MPVEAQNLIWTDLEMTGLDPDRDRIIEIATIVTDKNLNELATGPILAIHQPQEIMDGMDDWNQRTHGGSGLTKRVANSGITEKAAEDQTIAFLEQWVKPGESPMCGNSICQDRRFLYRWMPKLCNYFHYRNLDVSTVKSLAQYWAPEVAQAFVKESRHEALLDIRESIAEMQYYRERFIRA